MPNEIHDLRKTKHFIVDHRIIDEYLPAIGSKAFQLYAIYCRIASTYNKVFPSYRTIRKNTGWGLSQILKYNKILGDVGLIRIVRGTLHSGYKDNNQYILLEPKKLSDEIKEKYYPKNWEPILKSKLLGVPKTGTPKTEKNKAGVPVLGTPVFPKQEHRDSILGTPVFLKQEHINNNTVVVNNKTTTEDINQLIGYLKLNTSLSVVGFSGMEKIINTALHKTGDKEKALAYIISKIDFFKESLHKKKNPMGFLHDAVKENFEDYEAIIQNSIIDENETIEYKRQKENEERKKEEQHLKDIKQKAWMNLKPRERAEYYMSAMKFIYSQKNGRKHPSESKLKEITDELIDNNKWESIVLDFPAPNFHL